jgi:hypothetical protein
MTNRVRWSGDTKSRDSNSSSSQNTQSDQSSHSQETAPTEYSYSPQLQRWETGFQALDSPSRNQTYDMYDDYKASVETYASTIPSEDEVSDLVDDENSQEALTIPDEEYRAEAIPSTPRDFAELFPSADRISILHDDATLDGNMNLRLDTQIELSNGQKRPLTLFHLRMHDLKNREFSLRRYCRDSGREVCHSIRKYHQSSAERKPALQKSFTSALSSLRKQADSHPTLTPDLKRSDSGYASMFGGEDVWNQPKPARKQFKRPTNTVKLEFSNYAHVEVKRRGAGAGKRYEFEYWGSSYIWKRQVKKDGDFTEISYHLVRDGNTLPLAHIVPAMLTTSQAEAERLRGGWVPPCSLWIKDDEILNSPDVAE